MDVSDWIPIVLFLTGGAIWIIRNLEERDATKRLRKLVAGLLADSDYNRLTRELHVLRGTLQSFCLEHDRPLSEDLSKDVSELRKVLRALEIKTPKISISESDCPKAWHSFLEQVIPDLEVGDIERARSALQLSRVPRRK